MDDCFLRISSQRLIQLLDVLVHQAYVRWSEVETDFANIELEVEKVLFTIVIRTFVWMYASEVETMWNEFGEKCERVH